LKKLKAIVFDVDGTIADTEKNGHRVAFNLAFEELKLDWYWSVAEYGILLSTTGGRERLLRYIKESHPNFKPTKKSLNDFIIKTHKIKTKFYLQLLKMGNIKLRPGIARLIKEARDKNIILAIATTTTYANVELLLKTNLGSDSINLFAVIGAGDIVQNKKPAPDIYQYVLDKLKLNSDDCIAIEDSYQGLCSATNADIRTIITDNSYTQKQDFSKSILHCNHLGENENPCTIHNNGNNLKKIIDIDLMQSLL